MTWGSNPTWCKHPCPRCGEPMTDDGNPPSHDRECSKRLANRLRALVQRKEHRE